MYQLSRYNKFVKYKNKFLYFNTLTKSNFLMTCDEHSKMQEQLKDPITFSLQFPSVFSKFKEWGFIVESDVSEFDVIKYRHFSEMFSPAGYHVAVNLCNEILLDDQVERFVLLLGKYVKNTMKSQPKPICMEWILSDAASYRDVAIHTNKYVKQLCAKNKTDFYSQADLTDAVIDEDLVVECQNMDIRNFRLRLAIDHQMSVDRFCIDDLTKVEQLMEKINMILHHSTGALYIDSFFHSEIPVEKIVAFFDRISEDLRKRVQIKILLHGKTTAQQHIQVFKGVSELGFQFHFTAWKNMAISPDHITIAADGNVFFDRYIEYDETRRIGKLNAEGIIEWDETKKAFYYGRVWFDNEHCRECPYLGVLRDFCKDYVHYHSNSFTLNCPVKFGVIHGDAALVNMYETKHILVPSLEKKDSK